MLGDLGATRPASTIKARKKGSRLANRRVSFAPDDQLKTMHLYTKVHTLPLVPHLVASHLFTRSTLGRPRDPTLPSSLGNA